MTLTLTPDEVAYVRKSPKDNFVPDTLDVNVTFEFDGQPPGYPPGDHRITPDCAVANIPVFDFLTELVSACLTLQRSPAEMERVYVTSTNYSLNIRRKDELIDIQLVHLNPEDVEQVVGSTSVERLEFVGHCAKSCRLFLATLNKLNRDLGKNSRIRELAAANRFLLGTVAQANE